MHSRWRYEFPLRLLALALALGFAFGRPASYREYLGLEGDVASVGSLRREVRQPAPISFAREVSDLLQSGNEPRKHKNKKVINNMQGKSDEGGYYRTYGSDADGEKGYEQQTHSKGNHGYKTYDTFHKRNGDNYGFEKQQAFGGARGAEDGAGHAKHKSKHGDHEGAGTYLDSYYAGGDDHAGYTDGGEGYSHYGYGNGDGDGSYDHSENEGYNESYSTDGDDDGSYESHSSYTSDGDGSDEDYY